MGVFAGDLVPFETWRGGQPEGLGVDYARLLAGRAGFQLEFRPYTDWNAIALGDSKRPMPYDLLLSQPVIPQRLDRFHMLRPFAPAQQVVLVARKGDLQIRGADDLNSARIVVERRFRTVATVLHEEFPRATLVYSEDGAQALDMLARGEADAYAGLTAARTRTLVQQRQTDDVAILGPFGLPGFDFAPAVRRDRNELASILRKAEATIGERELTQLRARWGLGVGDVPAAARPGITDAERDRLAGLPVLRVGYEIDRYPYSFLDRKGSFDGMAADYLRILQEKTGLRLELVPAQDWNSLERMVLAREVDLIAAGSSEDMDAREMGFSQPYEYFPEVIVARTQGPPIAGPKDLAGKTVSVRDEAGVVARLRALLPRTRLLAVGSNEEGLTRVADGEADAYVGTLPAIDALIRNRYAAELRVVGPAGMDTELAFGVRREHEELLPVIDRVLDGLDEGERQAIRARWLTTDYVYGVPWGWVGLGAAAVVLVLGGVGFAYARLRRASGALAKAERALATQLAFQQALIETIPYPVFVKDAQGRYLAVNRAYEEAFACGRDRVIGRTLVEAGHLGIADSQALHQQDLALLEARASTRRELQLPATAGDEDAPSRSILLWLHTFEAGDGEPRLLGTVVDVSDIRAAEARARASEQRLTDITRAMPGTVFQVRVDPEGRRRFTYVAGDTVGLMGMSIDELLADQPEAFSRVHVDDQPRINRNVDIAVATLQPMPPFDFRFRVGDRWRWLRTEGGVPRRLADGSVEWSGYWVDTTALHDQAEALGEAKARAEAAVEAKGIFLAAMSHEIRTPMTGVLGLMELLTHTPLDGEQASMATMARDSARSLLQILDDILDYSRIESGRLSIEEVDFNLRDLVDSVVGLFAARAREANVRFYCMVDWRVAHVFRGDAMRIRQVLGNLLSNALKFTARGHVALQVRLLDEAEGRQHLRIEVSDTGIGIAPAHLSRLFQPFTQAEDSTTRRFGGTGLGLAISRRLARMMGGELRLQSETGAGTQALFELTLPVMQSLSPQPGFEGRTAVVCVADPLRSQEISNGLSSFGFSLVEVEAADLAEYDRHDADLFVVDADVQLPEALADAVLLPVAVGPGQDHAPLSARKHVLHGDPQSLRMLLEQCLDVLGLREAEGDSSEPTGSPMQHARILVAEDHPINRAVIGRQLERLGYPYTMVADGEEALDELARGQYDLLLTDCHMPVRDGYALTRRVREEERAHGKRLPVIGFSASVLPEEIQRGRDAGMDDVLAKPIQLDALAAKLAAFLQVPAARDATDGGSEASGLDRLLAVYRDPDQLRQVLQDLVAITRSELAELDAATAEGDAARQRELLHRMEGALSLVMAKPPARGAGGRREPEERRNAIVATLADIEAMLQAKDAPPSLRAPG
ncbi:MAG TPA: transporter substrate-binding domain-containing protein [Lysobacter sp.]